MKNKKDIFDLFRNNEHKLDERPDNKLWDRLEERLDQPGSSEEPHRAPRRTGMRQWMAMAGVMLALVVVISVANIMLRGGAESKQSADMTTVSPTFEMEEIGIFSDKGPNYTVGEYQKILARLNTSPILEGDPNKKIRIQESVFASLSERSKQQIAYVDKILRAEKEADSKMNESSEKIASEPIQLADNNNTDDAAYADLDMNGDDVLAQADMKEGENTKNKAGASYEAASSAEVEMMAEEEDAATISLSSSNSVSGGVVDTQGSIQQFKWILGKWEAPGSDADFEKVAGKAAASSAKKAKRKKKDMFKESGKDRTASNLSVEEWKPLNEFTIAGQGYLVVNGDTTFTESMQIKRIDSDLYYILALDKSGQTVKYKLKSYTEEEAVFENEAVAFPNQVILQRDFSNGNFTTVLQNNMATQINTEQQEYLQNRNVIRNEQVKRVMNRVEE